MTSSPMSRRRWTVRADMRTNHGTGALLAAALVWLASAAPAAQTSNALQRCHGYAASPSRDPSPAVAACTAVIESGEFTREQKLDAQAVRGSLLRRTGQFDFAIVDLTEVLRSRSDADALYVERGMAYVGAKEPGLAMVDFNDALRINPDNRSALSQRATLFRATRHFDEAIRDLDRAVALDRDDPWAVSERGLDYLSTGDFDRAIADFSRALELTPTSAWTMAERGVAYLRAGQFDRAIADLTRALELDEGDALALYARGVARRKSGDVTGGNTDIEAAMKLWPNVGAAGVKEGIRP